MEARLRLSECLCDAGEDMDKPQLNSSLNPPSQHGIAIWHSLAGWDGNVTNYCTFSFELSFRQNTTIVKEEIK